jgi:hypothetical protein
LSNNQALQKQKIVALSSCEAEYIAPSTTSCQTIWLNRLLGEMLGEDPRKVKLFVHNKSAIALCKNPIHHGRSKHIDTRFHFIRKCIEEGKVDVDQIPHYD